MSDEFEQALRIFAVIIGITFLLIGLSNLFSRPIIDVEDPGETINSIVDWFFDLGGGIVATIIGFSLIVLGVFPEALSVIIEGRLR